MWLSNIWQFVNGGSPCGYRTFGSLLMVVHHVVVEHLAVC